jgi:hypothetical protein
LVCQRVDIHINTPQRTTDPAIIYIYIYILYYIEQIPPNHLDVVPMLLEKLRLTSSDAIHAKIDALRTLIVCAPTYGARYLAPFLQELSQALLLLMFSADDASIEKATLDAIQAIAKHIAMEAIVVNMFNEVNVDAAMEEVVGVGAAVETGMCISINVYYSRVVYIEI